MYYFLYTFNATKLFVIWSLAFLILAYPLLEIVSFILNLFVKSSFDLKSDTFYFVLEIDEERVFISDLISEFLSLENSLDIPIVK